MYIEPLMCLWLRCCRLESELIDFQFRNSIGTAWMKMNIKNPQHKVLLAFKNAFSVFNTGKPQKVQNGPWISVVFRLHMSMQSENRRIDFVCPDLESNFCEKYQFVEAFSKSAFQVSMCSVCSSSGHIFPHVVLSSTFFATAEATSMSWEFSSSFAYARKRPQQGRYLLFRTPSQRICAGD